ncbi:starch-binding protein, partial [Bifidobacterium adolescentis]
VIPTKSVKIDQGDYSVDLSDGVATKQLTATTDPKGASVSWSSSDKDVATVSPKGVVTPRKAGKATITAKSGTKTSSITVTVTGELPPDPVAKNTVYASKPSGWGKIYAYVYTGDGATAANNAAWPGVEMTAPSATDGCQQTDLYKYVVPDNLAKGAKVIFNDGGSQQYPGSRQPGLDYNGGIVKWDGSSAALAAVECETTIPVTSVSVSGDGVSDGKLSLKSGASAQLTATVKPDNATDRKVTWTSSDSSVANVMGTGVVTAGSKAGKATVTATAGGKSASVEVTVEAQDPYAELDALAKAHASDLEDGTYTVSTALKDGMVLDVADGSAKDGANARLWSSNGTKAQRWTVSHDSKGYVTLRNVNSGKALDVKDGKAANGSNVQQYAPNSYRSQKWVAVRSGSVYKLVSALSPSMALDVKDGKAANGSNVQIYTANGYRSQQWTFGTVGQSLKSATVWYRPSSTQSRVRVQWRVYGSPDTTGGVEMTQACGGWWKATVPSAGSTKVGLSFSYGSTTDDNGGKLYDVKGESAAVSGGQAVTDVTPNCAVTNKQ